MPLYFRHSVENRANQSRAKINILNLPCIVLEFPWRSVYEPQNQVSFLPMQKKHSRRNYVILRTERLKEIKFLSGTLSILSRDPLVSFAAVFGMSRNAWHPKKRLRRRLGILWFARIVKIRSPTTTLLELQMPRQIFSVHNTPEAFFSMQQSPVNLDLCLKKTRAWELSRLSLLHCFRKTMFSKCFPSTIIRKAVAFKFLRFEERFRKAPFSWRISVDGRPNRPLSNFSGVVWTPGPWENESLLRLWLKVHRTKLTYQLSWVVNEYVIIFCDFFPFLV